MMGQFFSSFTKTVELPEVISISLVDFCNSKCRHCEHWKREQNSYVPYKAMRKILLEAHQAEKEVTIILAGGEPTLHPDFFKILDIAKQVDVPLHIATNGILFTNSFIERIIQYDKLNISFSLEGDAKTNYAIRRVDTHDKILHAINTIRTRNPNIGINISTVIQNDNLTKIIDFTSFLIDKKIPIQFQAVVDDNFLSKYKEEGFSQKSPLWPTDGAKVNTVLDELKTLKEKHPEFIINTKGQFNHWKKYFSDPILPNIENCMLGQNNVEIDPFGYLYLCYNFDWIGNISSSRKKLSYFWNSKKAEEIREKIKQCHNSCHLSINCRYD